VHQASKGSLCVTDCFLRLQVNENRNYEEGEAKVGTNVYLMIGGKQYTLPYESLRERPLVIPTSLGHMQAFEHTLHAWPYLSPWHRMHRHAAPLI
jgi:hypothetical protein